MQTSSVFNPFSPQAHAITSLFVQILIICGVILGIVTILVVYCLIFYRSRPGQPEPRQFGGHKLLEIIWTAIPTLLLVFMFVLTVRAMNASDPPHQEQEPDVIIVGHQFWWEARYPKSGAVTANEIHIPTGRPLLFRLESRDVIHDFWVPQLSRKSDLIPGKPNAIWLQANQPGTYHGYCAEFCGDQHAGMRIMVVAQTPEEFAAWEQHQLQPAPAPATSEARRGAQLFQQMTCVNCHAVRGATPDVQVAPDLTHVASRRTLGAGVRENTPENLAHWIQNPQAVKPGNLMPNMQLSQSQVADLLNYLETLR